MPTRQWNCYLCGTPVVNETDAARVERGTLILWAHRSCLRRKSNLGDTEPSATHVAQAIKDAVSMLRNLAGTAEEAETAPAGARRAAVIVWMNDALAQLSRWRVLGEDERVLEVLGLLDKDELLALSAEATRVLGATAYGMRGAAESVRESE